MFALDDDTPNHLRLPFLKVLPGVGNPLASALLTVFAPKKYSILDSRAVGRLTTVARHHEEGPIALGVVKRNTPADAVLDVRQIARWAGCFGNRTTVVPVEGARHDVFLSVAHAREHAYREVDHWLSAVLSTESENPL